MAPPSRPAANDPQRDGRLPSLSGGTVSNKVPARCEVVLRAPGGTVQIPDAEDASPSIALARQLFGAWKSQAEALRPERHASFDPDRAVVNWGVAHLQGGSGKLTFDCRLLPGHRPEDLFAGFETQARALARAAGAELTIEVNRASPAMELSEPSELLSEARAACRDVGLPDAPACKPTNTEAGIFAAAGAQAIVFGPGRSTGNAHCANEHNLASQLEKAIPFHQALIRRLCAA